MKRLTSLALLLAFTIPAFCAEQTFNNVPVVDTMCSKKVADNPDAHTKACAIACQGGGFGIITSDKKFLKFDSAGNQKVLAAIKSSKKEDHLRVDVSGDVQGDTLKVTTVKLL
ncbi:MAG: hypothetical protein JOZ10_09425 [Acidobacteria bacterium]|nr:hypothetical protein [Acidobacteriota bacterium]MBV9147393.1 hypothetical protein [Acidobacteriota bacterium]MBV9436516.1 hypothetical protein [Acidobacteriota bacterium]